MIDEKTKQKLLVFVITFTTLCPTFFISRPSEVGWDLYLASLLGFIGISLLTWMFILGTRSVSGLFFKDLVSKIQLHKKLGKYGTLLIFLHPLLMNLSYGRSLFYTLSLNLSSSYERHVTLGRLAFGALLIIWISSALLRSQLKFRPWKYIHYLAYPALAAGLLHAPEIGHSFNSSLVQFYWYSLVSVVLICGILRVRFFFSFGKVSYTLVSKKILVGEVWLLKLKADQIKLQIENGQYLYLQLGLFGGEHPFSVLDCNPQSGEISLACKELGKFTRSLKDIQPGTHFWVDGPYGNFLPTTNHNSAKRVYIAGGIGITPFFQTLSAGNDSATLIYANRNPDQAAFIAELRIKLKHSLIEVYSDFKDVSDLKLKDQDNKIIEAGFVDSKLLSKRIKNINQKSFYICGPSQMNKLVKHSLLSLGVSKKNIHCEEFSF